MHIRKAVFSGSWYPDDPDTCEAQIQSFMDAGRPDEFKVKSPVGGIVPHAGWYYSGYIACNVFHALKAASPPDVIAIFGMHLHPESMNYIMSEGGWETPFGVLSVDTQLAAALIERFDFHVETPERFTRDNTIELQLPFIKFFFPDATIVPIGVPPALGSLEVGRAVVEIAGEMGRDLRIVGSTDLTHYGSNYGFTHKGTGTQAVSWVREENDRKVIDAMLAMDAEQVIRQGQENKNACCAGAAAAAIAACKSKGAEEGVRLAYATSYDKSPGESFVGYVGIVY